MPAPGPSGWDERSAFRYLPFVGHSSPGVVNMLDGSSLAMGRMQGISYELMSDDEKKAASRRLHEVWRQIHDDNITIGSHLVHLPLEDDLPAPRFRSEFPQQLHEALTKHVLHGRLWQNDWFTTAIVHPRLLVTTDGVRQQVKRLADKYLWRIPPKPANPAVLESLWSQLERGLHGYGLKRLGYRHKGENNEHTYTEIGEAMRLILYGEGLPMRLHSGPLGSLIYDTRATFPTGYFTYQGLRGIRYGQSFCYLQYMASTLPGMMSALLRLDVPFVLSQSARFFSRPAAVQNTKLKSRQYKSTGDEARSLRRQLRDTADDVSSGRTLKVSHYLVLTVTGGSYEEMLISAGKVRQVMAESMATITPEDLANEAAFFSQLPTREWRTAPGNIPADNLADLIGWCGHPTGRKEKLRWDTYLTRLPTVDMTAYDFDPFVGSGDVAHMFIAGDTGVGKSTLLSSIVALSDQYMAGPLGGNIVLFGKDRRNEPLCHAMRGHNLYIKAGESSGCNPLLGFKKDTPYARTRLRTLIRALILSDGLGPLLPEDDADIGRGVIAMLNTPLAERSFRGLRQFLCWRRQLGAGPRFERWCRADADTEAGALWWVFDGYRDDVSFDRGFTHIDLTEVLDTPEVVEPLAQYLRDRIGEIIDGRRIIVAFDEAPSYMLAKAFENDILDFLRTLRGRNGFIILISQRAELMLKGAFGATLVGQCHTIWAAADPNADGDVFCEKMGFTKGQFAAMKRLLPFQWVVKRREGLDESTIVDFDLSRLPRKFMPILSGRSADVGRADATGQEPGSNAWMSELMKEAA